MLDSQSHWEMEGLVLVLKHWGVKSMLEIGSKYGSTAKYLANKCALNRVVMVDLPNGPGGRRDTVDILQENAADMKRRGLDARVILGDSQDQQTVAEVQQYAPFDFVFIDGDHSYEATRSDWVNYGPMGQIVAFHDIAGDGKGKEGRFEVGKVWKAIKMGWRPTFEIVEYGRKMGIGVVWNGD